jgi:hypothetical protein
VIAAEYNITWLETERGKACSLHEKPLYPFGETS